MQGISTVRAVDCRGMEHEQQRAWQTTPFRCATSGTDREISTASRVDKGTSSDGLACSHLSFSHEQAGSQFQECTSPGIGENQTSGGQKAGFKGRAMSRIDARLDKLKEKIWGKSRSPSMPSISLSWFQRVKRTCSGGGLLYRKGYRLLSMSSSPVMESDSEEALLIGQSPQQSRKKLKRFVNPFDPCADEVFPHEEDTMMHGIPKEVEFPDRHVCSHSGSRAGKCSKQPSIHSSAYQKQPEVYSVSKSTSMSEMFRDAQHRHSLDTVSKSTSMTCNFPGAQYKCPSENLEPQFSFAVTKASSKTGEVLDAQYKCLTSRPRPPRSNVVVNPTGLHSAQGTSTSMNRYASRDSGIGQSTSMITEYPGTNYQLAVDDQDLPVDRASSQVKNMALSECQSGESSTNQASQKAGQGNMSLAASLLNPCKIVSGISNFIMSTGSFIVNLASNGISLPKFGSNPPRPQCPIPLASLSALSADYRANKNTLCRPDYSSSPNGEKKEKEFQRFAIWYPCHEWSGNEDHCGTLYNLNAAMAERCKKEFPTESKFLSRLFREGLKAFSSSSRKHSQREQHDIVDHQNVKIWNKKMDKFIMDAVKCRNMEKTVINKTFFQHVADQNEASRSPPHSSDACTNDSLLWAPFVMLRDYCFPSSGHQAAQEINLESSGIHLSCAPQPMPTSVNSPVIDESLSWTSRLRTWFFCLGRRLEKTLAKKKGASEWRGRRPGEEAGTSHNTGPHSQHTSASSPASSKKRHFAEKMKDYWISFKKKCVPPEPEIEPPVPEEAEEEEEEEEEEVNIDDPADVGIYYEIMDHSMNAVNQSFSSEESGYVEQSPNPSTKHLLDSTAWPRTTNIPIEVSWSSRSPDVCATSSDEEAGHGRLNKFVSHVSLAVFFSDSDDTDGEAEDEGDASAADAVHAKTL